MPLNILVNILDRFSIILGKSIAWLPGLMVLLTCIVVIMRYLFDSGATATQEAVTYLHGMVFMLSIGYTLQQSGHVRVDILYQKFSPRLKALVNLLGTVIFLFPMAGFIFWSSLDYVSFSWQLKEASYQPGGLPWVYWLKTLIPLMAGLLLLQGVAQFCRHLTELIKRPPDPPNVPSNAHRGQD